MFRRQALIALAAFTFAVSAQASKARLQALGQSENGSLYIEDARGVFLNPASIHLLPNTANFEFGSSTVPSTPNSEGGLLLTSGDVKMGLQLNRESNAAQAIQLVNDEMVLGLASPQNNVEFIFGGGAESKWGFAVLYGTTEDNAEVVAPATSAYPNKKANTLELRGGLLGNGWNGWVHLDLQSRSENETANGTVNKFEGSPSLRAGATMDLEGDRKVYAQALWWNFKGRKASDTADREGSASAIDIGWVQFLTPETGARLFYTAGLRATNYLLKNNGGNPEKKVETLAIPLLLGLEYEALEWLTLRSSVGQNVLIDQKKTTVTDHHNPNSTTVAAGAGLKWKKLTLDGTLEGTSTGKLNASTLLANVSLSYAF